MSQYLPFVVIGLTVGAVYGVAAMGLVLSYKTSGVFNFGHGAIAAAAAVVFYELRQGQGLPWPVAAVLAVLVFGALAGIVMERIARGLASVPTSAKIVATIGLIVAIRSLVVLIYGPSALLFKAFLPQRRAFAISGVSVSYENVIVALFGVGSAIALYLFFQRTRLGTAMRGVVDDPDLLDMSGTSPVRVRRTAWIIGCCFAAVSGVLFASTQQQLDVTLLSLLVVQAFGAAAIARFTSLPLSFAGGLAIGLLQAIVSKEAGTHSLLRGVDTNIPFLVLFAVLLFTPRRRLVELGRRVRPRVITRATLPSRARFGIYAAVVGAALFVPYVVGTRLVSWDVALAQMVLYLSLALLVRTSGQISLCQIGFAGVGGAALGHLLQGGFPWPVAVLLAGLAVVPVGALISIPAIRLSGLYLALATLGFGILLAQYFYTKSYLFGTHTLATARPSGFASDRAYFYVLLVFALASVLVVVGVERSRLGRLLRGLADSPTALATLGTSVNVTRVLVFCLSAFLAGVSGALTACVFGQINGDSYPYVQSIVILAILAISGGSTVWAAVIAPLISVLPPAYLSGANVNEWLQVGFGVAAIGVSLLSQGRFSDLVARGVARSAARTTGPSPNRVARRARPPGTRRELIPSPQEAS